MIKCAQDLDPGDVLLIDGKLRRITRISRLVRGVTIPDRITLSFASGFDIISTAYRKFEVKED